MSWPHVDGCPRPPAREVPRVAGGGWGITNLDSGKCLDAQWSHSNSTTLVRYDCYAGATQQWHG